MSRAGDNCCDFAGDYDLAALPAFKQLERQALDSDYGATSWTTRSQVDDIVDSLELHAGSRLLDIGSGSGWPGLLLGKLSQCQLALVDMPLNALRQAAERAAEDEMLERVNIVSGSGTSLPFKDDCFDSISHSDVLCCLPQKMDLLRESRRVACDGARMHFSVILPAADLTRTEHREVIAAGPPFVAVDGLYADLLHESGWQVTGFQDVTADYKDSLCRLLDGIEANAAELEQILGADELVSRRRHRENQVRLIERGLMVRQTYAAIAACFPTKILPGKLRPDRELA